jgi:flagella synthesis protein FlgN
MSENADSRGLPVHLRAAYELTQRFIELLRTEQHALIAGDVDAVAELARSKADLVEQSIRVAAERDSCLRAAGFPAGQPGMESWVAAHPRAQAGWGEYLAGARVARELNRTNGTLIAIRLGRANQALAVLFAGAPDATLTYCADGRTSVAATSRPLASA